MPATHAPMTAAAAKRLSHQELEVEFQYTCDQIKRLYNQINAFSIGQTIKRKLKSELQAYKADFTVITNEFERRYIP